MTAGVRGKGVFRGVSSKRRLAAALIAGLLACRDQPQEADQPALNESEPSTRIVTDSTAYSLRFDDPGWTTTIGFTYRAKADTVYIVNCNGAILMNLQKLESDRWTDAWYAEGDACLSPPIVVPPSGELKGKVVVWGAEFGVPSYNTFRVSEIDGEYRLVWNQPVHHYDARPGSLGDSIPMVERVSNPFTLERASANR